VKIRFCGVGGQGVIQVAYILGYAAMIDGYRVLQTRSYGSAYRGMLSKSDIIISRNPIYELEFIHPDILVCLSEKAYDAYKYSVHPELQFFIDSDSVKMDLTHPKLYSLNASTLSYDRFGDRLYANMIMLGYMVAVSRVVSKDSVEKSLTSNTPKGTENVNLEAFQLGYSIGLDAK